MSISKTDSSNPTSVFDEDFKDLVEKQNTPRRIKERMIEDALYLVLRWRQLSENKSKKKVTLKEGADIIGVAKKSLDDYLLQLRLGRKYGFDFNKHGSSKIGILRTFNKKMKRKMKEAKFSAGRKKKEEEENYSDMINKIIMEIHAPKLEDFVQADEATKLKLNMLSVNWNLNELTAETITKPELRTLLPNFSGVSNITNSDSFEESKDKLEQENCTSQIRPTTYYFQDARNNPNAQNEKNIISWTEELFDLEEQEDPFKFMNCDSFSSFKE